MKKYRDNQKGKKNKKPYTTPKLIEIKNLKPVYGQGPIPTPPASGTTAVASAPVFVF